MPVRLLSQAITIPPFDPHHHLGMSELEFKLSFDLVELDEKRGQVTFRSFCGAHPELTKEADDIATHSGSISLCPTQPSIDATRALMLIYDVAQRQPLDLPADLWVLRRRMPSTAEEWEDLEPYDPDLYAFLVTEHDWGYVADQLESAARFVAYRRVLHGVTLPKGLDTPLLNDWSFTNAYHQAMLPPTVLDEDGLGNELRITTQSNFGYRPALPREEMHHSSYLHTAPTLELLTDEGERFWCPLTLLQVIMMISLLRNWPYAWETAD